MLPFILRRVGADPATSSAPFVATLVDVTGLIIYFSIALLIMRGVNALGNEPVRCFRSAKFFGHDEKFFDLLERSAQQADNSVHHLVELLEKLEQGNSPQSLDAFAHSRREDKRITQELTEAALARRSLRRWNAKIFRRSPPRSTRFRRRSKKLASAS